MATVRWPVPEDHPRSRGVYVTEMGADPDGVGSSPLARGLPAVEVVHGGVVGIIPARAGFTALVRRGTAGARDHPRSRGVYSWAATAAHCWAGSSPLARGLRCDRIRGAAAPRIIPARAGFTPGCRSGEAPGADHPRSRGVYDEDRAHSEETFGSSPLARGLLATDVDANGAPGIIPARAGFTSALMAAALSPWDHPRSRGVYSSWYGRRSRQPGSSPLARGLRPARCRGDSQWRIIPARAGFTPRPQPARSPPTDHPRSRGVYARCVRGLTSSIGSSPLARGLRLDADGEAVLTRIIPARAGFTTDEQRRVPGRVDHPRSRGVYWTRIF